MSKDEYAQKNPTFLFRGLLIVNFEMIKRAGTRASPYLGESYTIGELTGLVFQWMI